MNYDVYFFYSDFNQIILVLKFDLNMVKMYHVLKVEFHMFSGSSYIFLSQSGQSKWVIHIRMFTFR